MIKKLAKIGVIIFIWVMLYNAHNPNADKNYILPDYTPLPELPKVDTIRHLPKDTTPYHQNPVDIQ